MPNSPQETLKEPLQFYRKNPFNREAPYSGFLTALVMDIPRSGASSVDPVLESPSAAHGARDIVDTASVINEPPRLLTTEDIWVTYDATF